MAGGGLPKDEPYAHLVGAGDERRRHFEAEGFARSGARHDSHHKRETKSPLIPKGTPKNVIAKLNAAVVDTLADPWVRQRLTDLGQEIWPREQQTPEALGAYQKSEIEKWWPIIKVANIKAE